MKKLRRIVKFIIVMIGGIAVASGTLYESLFAAAYGGGYAPLVCAALVGIGLFFVCTSLLGKRQGIVAFSIIALVVWYVPGFENIVEFVPRHWQKYQWQQRETKFQQLQEAVGKPCDAELIEDATSYARIAVRRKSDSVTAYLLRCSPPKTFDRNDMSELLEIAAREDMMETVTILVERGADVYAFNRQFYGGYLLYALNEAASNTESTRVLNYLLEKGAKVNSGNEDIETPLVQAVHASNYPAAHILIEHGADLRVKTFNGWTLLEDALWAKVGARQQLISLLADKAPDLITATVLENTTNDPKLFIWLLDKAATAHIPLQDDLIPTLANISGFGKNEKLSVEEIKALLTALIKYGVKVNTFSGTDNDITPLLRAVGAENIQIVDFLLSQGADINLRKDGAESALDMATRLGNVEMMKFLLRRGAKPSPTIHLKSGSYDGH